MRIDTSKYLEAHGEKPRLFGRRRWLFWIGNPKSGRGRLVAVSGHYYWARGTIQDAAREWKREWCEEPSIILQPFKE